MTDPQSLLVELKAHADSGDVDAGLSTLSKIKVRRAVLCRAARSGSGDARRKICSPAA